MRDAPGANGRAHAADYGPIGAAVYQSGTYLGTYDSNGRMLRPASGGPAYLHVASQPASSA